MAENSSDFLLTKINDILDYYEIENKTFKPNMVSFNIHNFMLSLKESSNKFMNSKTKNLSVLIAKNTPKLITQDKDRLKQVMQNIISNAVKYTEKGFIIITVDWETENRKNFIKFQVSDSGIGIPKSRNQEIYQIFGSRNHKEMNKDNNQASTKLAGLGLSIAQKILK